MVSRSRSVVLMARSSCGKVREIFGDHLCPISEVLLIMKAIEAMVVHQKSSCMVMTVFTTCGTLQVNRSINAWFPAKNKKAESHEINSKKMIDLNFMI
jgi:hypothetical protein